MSMLGEALMGQQQHDDAEPLLVAGYEGLKSLEESIPQIHADNITLAIERLIAFYAATNNPHEATKWKVERAKYQEK